jgi:type IV pilus assembly protein PilM
MSFLASWLSSPPPDAAVEISSERVSAASVSPRRNELLVRAYAMEPLPPGAVVSSLTAQNIVDPGVVDKALRRVLSAVGGARRVALLIPDMSAKVSIIRFDKVPDRREDLEQLVRWQIRKSAPFAIEDACVTYTPGTKIPNGSQEFIVVLCRRDIVREYETASDRAGAYAGLVDLATFGVLNLFLALPNAPSGDCLTVHMRSDYTSIAITRERDVIFFRNKPEGDNQTLADLVHQTAMYYQDRLGGQGFGRVLLGGAGRIAGSVELARRNLQERLGAKVEPIDPTSSAVLSNGSHPGSEVLEFLAPLVGMLHRTSREAVAA